MNNDIERVLFSQEDIQEPAGDSARRFQGIMKGKSPWLLAF